MKKPTIILGVTGGIACYKSADLVSRLVKKGFDVHVIMTRNATEFITPLTFQKLSSHKVVTNMFEKTATFSVEHISLAQIADLFVVVPASANFIGKMANGLADDMLTTTVMATKAPVIIAPAMNTAMWNNSILKDNIEKLKKYGVIIVDPAEGRLACGDFGKGKLAEMDDIMQVIEKKLVDIL
ncbi:bifunctional phosphopantothenoylcysteine decarboxylase/phosphopantothenate--cysteine ligase CoaBC [Alkalibacter mobilis]|uniref:bifunctional phosphopantothenoylcysteine decarboxylase/phosphopantothenate--cysteine ligase CoaBC n=1 Tax=Alkalibacter mobilis TaxID=2787712 RepID=UPI00189CA2D8|nr:bifunctional phosphopantothenoylcysteine decarboxylase/phosphopantothenate--cysteine ligase CoaBC [Alkalibacter mobilis]MBF7097543.1 bifunctional phosphopantothenoylcysteine decarboxylase/phosphopantothenate--cysteine ligase CoaBC [Alkalibacter mobilis]